MKNQAMELKSDLRTREANAVFAQDSQLKPESFNSGFKESIDMPSGITKLVASCFFTFLLLALAVPGFGQTEPRQSAVGHPIPSAPKKRYIPASFAALPELQCQLYPSGGTPSKGLTVYTDEDGYARFHAVRATAQDAVQSLALDCTDSAGKAYSYSVDLTSDDTFTPRPLNLENERGIDRPALQGDPLSYSQSELIKAGYGLRPDSTDTAAYARWLAAASTPGRMLDSKRPRLTSTPGPRFETKRPNHSSRMNSIVRPNTVHKITDSPWVGATLNGAPTYVSSMANFNVPTAVEDGDETEGSQIAIWNGVEGSGNNSGLIQGGVGVTTIGLAASYWSWREYCCGDSDSNQGAYDTAHGAFTPNPGDNIFSQEWYCDANGNLNPTGGYGCTFVHDTTNGGILTCTSSTGSPCPSVKALPNWTSIGTDADFVIEDQSPQCCGNSDTAFTDFTPQVNMSGSAYSSTTSKYSQTVTSDPLVYLLEDFTNTTSHMQISLGTTDETYFTSSQFAEVSGLASNNTARNVQSIGVGPNANGSPSGVAWTLGFNANSDGDYNIYQWQWKTSSWVKEPGAATHIAVSPEGYPWVVNHAGQIYYWNGSAFESAPGNACASWIGVGPNAFNSTYGDPWILGCNWQTNGYNVYQLQGSTWVHQPGQFTKLAVGPRGPWAIDNNGLVYYWNGSSFQQAPTACATSIGVGPLTAPFAGTYGDTWITGCHQDGNGYRIYQLYFGETWVEIPGIAAQISVSPDLGVPWVVNTTGHIYQ